MSKSKIEWCDRTWNPTTGCTKISKGCENCYAERHAIRFWGKRKFSDVQMHEDRLQGPFNNPRPSTYFVGSMSDIFHIEIPDRFISRVMGEVASACWHTYLILTKRPERMQMYFHKWRKITGDRPLANLWLGVSVEDQKTADNRIPLLLETPAAHRFVSYEPALGPVDFTSIKWARIEINPENYERRGVPAPDEMWSMNNVLKSNPGNEWTPPKIGLDWVIMGGESGAGARPCHPDWVRSARDQCRDAGVPFFFKQWGEWLPFCQKDDIEAKHDIPRKYIGDTKISMLRVGKKNAGRLIDGEEIMQFPEGMGGK